MIKVAGSIPSHPSQVANGFPPAPPVAASGGPPATVFTNPVATAELPEVNEPEKPPPEGEAMLGQLLVQWVFSELPFAIVSKRVFVRNHTFSK